MLRNIQQRPEMSYNDSLWHIFFTCMFVCLNLRHKMKNDTFHVYVKFTVPPEYCLWDLGEAFY